MNSNLERIMAGEGSQALGDMKRCRRRQKGVTTVEYAIMLLIIAIGVAGASPGISNKVASIFARTANCLNVIGTPC